MPSCGDGVGEEVLPRERGADRRGEWVHLSSGPPGVVVPCPCGGGGVSPAAQLYQRDWSVGSAHAGSAAPAAGAGRGGHAGGGGRAGSGGRAAALTRATVLEKDVGAQLTPSLASVEERGAALRVAGGHVGAVLERAETAALRCVPGPNPLPPAPRDRQAHFHRVPLGISPRPPRACLFPRRNPQAPLQHPRFTYPQQQLRDDYVGELGRQVKWGAKLRVLYAGVERPVSRVGQKQENGGHVLGLHRGPQLAAQRFLGSAQWRQEQQLFVLGANPRLTLLAAGPEINRKGSRDLPPQDLCSLPR